MLDKIFKIKDSIDIYVTDTETPNKVLLTFHRMTTRERTEILTSRTVAEFLALLDGKTITNSILNKLGSFDKNQAMLLIDYLMSERLIIDVNDEQAIDKRYKRQIAFFDDMLPKRSGIDTQAILAKKKVAILGCGAIGSHIAEILVRAGVLNFILVDYKIVSENHLARHLFVRQHDMGKYKADVLKNYLKN
ncbi:HesA/MoeB/ThiF family protein, partial [Ursidibacter arcticus]